MQVENESLGFFRENTPPPPMELDRLTPLLKQYWQIKSHHMDKILLFRMGDFFEMFYDDAVQAAPILGIALTSRNKKSKDETPMCGVPHHSVHGPIQKLLQANLKVAICDQVEDPATATGIVKRSVTRILSPGMVLDPEALDGAKANYIASFDETALAVIEPSTGESFYFRLRDWQSEIGALLTVIAPVEIVLKPGWAHGFFSKLQTLRRDDILSLFNKIHLTRFDPSANSDRNGSEELPRRASPAQLQTLAPTGCPDVTRALVDYAVHMQGESILRTCKPFAERQFDLHLELSSTNIRHLEIFETYQGEQKGSLFHAIRRTKTAAGARLLRSWLGFPLQDEDTITNRLRHIAGWVAQPRLLEQIRLELAHVGDIERRIGKISNPSCSGRDLLSLADSLSTILRISFYLQWQDEALQRIQDLVQEIQRSLLEEQPVSITKGHLIRPGVRPELDELIELSDHSQQALLNLETRERSRTGINSLKVRYNQVFGYYIEVTNTHRDKVPQDYHRKQTLTNAERFVTEELNLLEQKILSAKTRRAELEFEVFSELKQKCLELSSSLLAIAGKITELDVLTGLAWLAIERKYTRPEFSTDGSLEIENGRHPVVEQELGSRFVPNTIKLGKGDCLLLTGPNMAGKSTLMRQVALISILAQIGSFVPAERARLPIFDRIFTRIGASDFLSQGLSTFMVEMKEASDLVARSTMRSLILLDEIGRGTSTYDGLAIAQSILEYLLTNKKSLVLFATHYHELTRLEKNFKSVKNAHMAVRESSGEISFLHTLVRGPALRSHGIHVARLAGLPEELIDRAQSILNGLEGA